jgi:hypothetical protein
MIRYTVVWSEKAEFDLATLWLAYPRRQAITLAADQIDAELHEDAHLKGLVLPKTVRSISIVPLIAYFRVDEGDRKVLVEFIKLTEAN